MSVTWNLFYVDDDMDDHESFVLALKDITALNIQLHAFQSGNTFIRQFTKSEPKPVVFLDINMPGTSGFEVLKNLRVKYTKEELPIIMYSTGNDMHSFEKSKELGANLYLVKTFSHKGLVTNISKVLNDKLIQGGFKVINSK